MHYEQAEFVFLTLVYSSKVVLFVKSCFSRPARSGTIDQRYRGEKGTRALSTKRAQFFFSINLSTTDTHTAARQVAQRRMKARHQFKKSTPSVVAGKKCGPAGRWVAPPKSLPKRSPSARLVTCRISIIIRVFDQRFNCV